jgi:hypothetical protein
MKKTTALLLEQQFWHGKTHEIRMSAFRKLSWKRILLLQRANLGKIIKRERTQYTLICEILNRMVDTFPESA